MKKKKDMDGKHSTVIVSNRKAAFDYEFIDTVVAGIVLKGTEVKSLRQGKASISDSYCCFVDGELWLRNSYIAGYEMRGYVTHEEKADRKMLVTRQELERLERKVSKSGYTIIPSTVFLDGKGRFKIVLNLARGRKQYDKRMTIKERDLKRETETGTGICPEREF